MDYQDLQTQAHEALERPITFCHPNDDDSVTITQKTLDNIETDGRDLARAVLELVEQVEHMGDHIEALDIAFRACGERRQELEQENERLQRLLDAARFRADLPATSHGEEAKL